MRWRVCIFLDHTIEECALGMTWGVTFDPIELLKPVLFNFIGKYLPGGIQQFIKYAIFY